MESADGEPHRSPRPRWRQALALGALAILSTVAFRPILDNDFVDYDDPHYVTQNPAVQSGLSLDALRWAFTTDDAANWHPVTWISHMLDVDLFGLDPRGHHLTSLILHVANAMLLFLVLCDLTGAFGRSLAVAALFAVHPTRVESVAWVAERKDVLSALFWILTVGAYGAYARRPRRRRYLLTLALLAVGLMAKPMLVSLPVVLLLLDVWPLRRLALDGAAPAWRGLVREKLPLFALALASAIVTFLVQRAGGAVGAFERYPLGVRLANALVAYVQYLRQLVWPSGLAVFYPHPGSSLPAWQVAGAGALLAALTAIAVRALRTQPALFVGWSWFVITLVPVSGIVQVGWQARADRYTYVPYVGLFVAIVWGVGSLASRARPGTVVIATTTALAVALGGFAFTTRAQVRYWRNSETLFKRALEVTGDNAVAHYSLGHDLLNRGKVAESIPHFQQALRISPSYLQALHAIGKALVLLGRFEEAAAYYARAVRLSPGDVGAMNNLATCLLRQGERTEALRWYRAAAERAPQLPHLQHVQGMLLLLEGRNPEAIEHLERATALDPSQTEWRQDLEGALDLLAGRDSQAAARLRERLAVYPTRPSSAARSTSDSTSQAPPARSGGPGPGGVSRRP